jgi:hypothetical protein
MGAHLHLQRGGRRGQEEPAAAAPPAAGGGLRRLLQLLLLQVLVVVVVAGVALQCRGLWCLGMVSKGLVSLTHQLGWLL